MYNVHSFKQKKEKKQKIVMLTCYDYSFSKMLNDTKIDAVLVGDSCAMVMHGYPNTTFATVDMIATHTQGVSKGATSKYIVADLPFLSYSKSLSETIQAVIRLIHAGAQAVKLEGAMGHEATIEHIVRSGVPVMGHIGLTPQKYHKIGGFKPVVDTPDTQKKLLQEAESLERAGCFAVVLECINPKTARIITETLSIPTIGIGSGPYTDGQILVLQDILGLQKDFKPKFLKRYCHSYQSMTQGINEFVDEVGRLEYPIVGDHTY